MIDTDRLRSKISAKVTKLELDKEKARKTGVYNTKKTHKGKPLFSCTPYWDAIEDLIRDALKEEGIDLPESKSYKISKKVGDKML